jgi:hypothetical protein
MAIVIGFAVPLTDIGGSIRCHRRPAGTLHKVAAADLRYVFLSNNRHGGQCEQGDTNHAADKMF